MLPLLLRPPPRGPGRRHPAGELGRGRVGALGAPGGETAARGVAARPVSPGVGGRFDAGQGTSAGHCSPGAGEETPPLPGRPPLSMEPAARSPPLFPAAAEPGSAAVAVAVAAGGKSEARGSRDKTVVRTPGVQAAAQRQLRAAPTARIFKWARAAPPPRAPPCARPRACVPGPLRRGRGGGGRGLGRATAWVPRNLRALAAAERGLASAC